MPEYPDIVVYLERLTALLVGQRLEGIRLASPFVLRSVAPPLSDTIGSEIRGFERIGKRIIFVCEREDGSEIFIGLHLMIAGRLKWRKCGTKPPGKIGLAAFDFPNGTLLLTEASSKKRAALHVVADRATLAQFNRGGIDVFSASPAQFSDALQRENHTLKRSLTDPRLFDGIGNAYSDEILHRARLSPLRLTQRLDADEIDRLQVATVATLSEWAERLRADAGEFPEKVTAFREGMAAHGRYKKPCPDCGAPIQRIRYAANETNYCAECQNAGRLLADRAISRLLKKDWPKSLEELEELKLELRGDR